MKKSPLNRTGRLRPVSLRRKRESVIYSRLSLKFLDENPRCQVEQHDHDVDCRGWSQVVHHRKGRGKFYLAIETWLATSSVCHEKIERFRKWARERGYSLDRLAHDREAVERGLSRLAGRV